MYVPNRVLDKKSAERKYDSTLTQRRRLSQELGHDIVSEDYEIDELRSREMLLDS